ncbi:PREDICTED: serine/threonine-protein phosphatase 7 [Ipomoea nil]|uniref:serine/threonine-protein phosphatase 7 n=1 Tax=Ipomoea nil TaxID=35883 RepID=UPI000900F380|nr:PREDICTED: serine/threonine-protein phosphatase 7 [Ipomoea nil]
MLSDSAAASALPSSAPEAAPPPPPQPPSSDEDFFSSASVPSTSSSSEEEKQNNLTPSRSPSAPQIPISWPEDGILTLDWVTDLMLTFDWASRNLPPADLPTVLPVEVFDRLVLTASKILHKEPNCVGIDDGSGLGPGSRVVVVGDVHGQLHDVLFLLRDAGFPGEDRFFVFNGDYVDRGAWGLETFLLLLAWKVFMPQRVYLLRGNHESKYCTSVYGFEKEVLAKYGDRGKHVYRKCLGCFEGLPLASIIAGRVYTAHGGVFRSIAVTPSKRAKGKKSRRINLNPDITTLSLGSFEELAKARRSVLDPPWEGSNLIPGDVLWSDPSMTNGLSPNKERGIGLLWGPDMTDEFLRKCNLKLIIRSHEGPDAREKRPGLGGMDAGYTIDHVVESGKLITLFSAPDYPQFQATEDRYRNKGAYIVLEPPDFDTPIFHSFDAVTPRPKANPFYDFEDVIDSDEELDLASMVTS